MNEPIVYAKGSHVSKLHPAWDWVNRGAAAEGEVPPEGPALIDSWPVENQNDVGSYGIRDAMIGPYQAFTAPRDCSVKTVKLSLKRYGNPVGDLLAAIRDGSGEFPIVVPGGRITGSRKVDVTTISPDATDTAGILYAFDFLTPVPLVGGQKYCVVLEKISDANGTTFPSPDYVMAGFSFGGAAGHYGNAGSYQGDWSPDDLADMIFYLYEP
jgi:hypothetical protein